MSLTQEDLRKIKDVVNARAELTEARFDGRIDSLGSKMATKDDLLSLEDRLNKKIDQRTAMIQGDQFAIGRDLVKLKKLQPRVRKLEKQLPL